MAGSTPATPRGRRGWLALTAVGCLAMIAATGCSGNGASGASANAARGVGAGRSAVSGQLSKPENGPAPAAEAGGACKLLNYGVIQQHVRVEFGIAASAQSEATYTCLLQPRGSTFPDLALSVTATASDDKAFATVHVPNGSTDVSGLGKKAYSAVIAEAGSAGPGVEVGWLSVSKRLMVLRLRMEPGAQPATAAGAGPGLIELAKAVDVAGTIDTSPSPSPSAPAAGSPTPSQSPSGSAGR